MSIENHIRDVVKEVVRDELRVALRESLATFAVNDNQSEYLTIAQAAEQVGVHEGTVRKWIRNGELKGHRAGRHHRIRRAELEAFMTGGLDHDGDLDLKARAAALALRP
jgi:excisionase family DNA binding protein